MQLKNIIFKSIVISLVMFSFVGLSAYADNDTLERGDRGSDVEYLQGLLKDKGYFDYDKITGYFGKVTEDSVKKFQRVKGLKVDGVVGSATWAAVLSDSQDTQDLEESQTDNSNSSSFSKGMEGEEVEKIQRRLKELGLYNYDNITGYFGSITKSAVKSFQRACSLEDDGVVGASTWEKLFYSYQETSLIPGMISDEVKILQKNLKELGYYSYSVDGSYGKKTVEAVSYFQKANNLSADGIAGEKTRETISSPDAVKEQDARRTITSTKPSNDYSNSATGTASDLIDYVMELLGYPYVYATHGPDSFDCSGYTYYVYKQFGIKLSASAYHQGYDDYGIKITDRNDLKPGDIVLFDTIATDGDLSDHAGIYIGNGDFIHASCGFGNMSVVIDSMTDDDAWHTPRFSWARRVLTD